MPSYETPARRRLASLGISSDTEAEDVAEDEVDDDVVDVRSALWLLSRRRDFLRPFATPRISELRNTSRVDEDDDDGWVTVVLATVKRQKTTQLILLNIN